MIEDIYMCPKCGLYNPWHEETPTNAPTCNPIRSPDCWRVEQTYNHDLRHWVMTHEPGGEAPTATQLNDLHGPSGDAANKEQQE